MSQINSRIDGLDALMKNFRTLPDRVQKKVMMKAVNAGTKPVQAAAAAKAPKRFGTLARSMARKVKQYPSGVTAGIIGPSAKYEEKVTIDGHTIRQKPANYAHLVEYGHRIAVGGKLERTDGRKPKKGTKIGKSSGVAMGQPFMRPALIETAEESMDIMAEKIGKGVEQEAAKGARG